VACRCDAASLNGSPECSSGDGRSRAKSCRRQPAHESGFGLRCDVLARRTLGRRHRRPQGCACSGRNLNESHPRPLRARVRGRTSRLQQERRRSPRVARAERDGRYGADGGQVRILSFVRSVVAGGFERVLVAGFVRQRFLRRRRYAGRSGALPCCCRAAGCGSRGGGGGDRWTRGRACRPEQNRAEDGCRPWEHLAARSNVLGATCPARNSCRTALPGLLGTFLVQLGRLRRGPAL